MMAVFFGVTMMWRFELVIRPRYDAGRRPSSAEYGLRCCVICNSLWHAGADTLISDRGGRG
jgi:hypothetical protein